MHGKAADYSGRYLVPPAEVLKVSESILIIIVTTTVDFYLKSLDVHQLVAILSDVRAGGSHRLSGGPSGHQASGSSRTALGTNADAPDHSSGPKVLIKIFKKGLS